MFIELIFSMLLLIERVLKELDTIIEEAHFLQSSLLDLSSPPPSAIIAGMSTFFRGSLS
jgi:hypothetical protein